MTHPARAVLVAAGLALAMTGSATAQIANPPRFPEPPEPIIVPIVTPCSQIASFSPASARPGQDVDIHLVPPSGRTFMGYTVIGVQFANNVPATFTNVAAHHVRAKVPVGAANGPVRVTCRSTITNGIWTIASAGAFTPLNLGNTLTPSTTTLQVGNSTTITTTLSHPAPEPMTLTLTPQPALSVQGRPAGTPGTLIIPAGSQSAQFSVGAHAAAVAGATVAVTGTSVAGATLTVTVPAPAFTLTVPDDEAEVHWGDSASYAVEVASQNGFAGTVTLRAGGLPFGAAAAPVSVPVPAGGTTTATFTVTTDDAATALGTDSFTLRGESPGVADRTRSLDLRVLPDEGAFLGVGWRTGSSTCDGIEADVTGTNITFDGPGFSRTQAHTHLRYAWTPHCRGAVVMGTAAAANAGVPMSIFNFEFDNAIADAPGSRHNLGTAAWHHGHFKVSSDGSFLIAVAEGNTFRANLFDMLALAQRPPMHAYSLAETLSASIVGDEIQAQPSGSSNDWTWTLP